MTEVVFSESAAGSILMYKDKDSRKDVFRFPLWLSVGEIDEEGVGSKRRASIDLLMSVYQDTGNSIGAESVEASRKSLSELLARAEEGESVRIWSSDNPDEMCGLYWLIHQLYCAGVKKPDIIIVKLPEFYMTSDTDFTSYTYCGEIAPQEWGGFAELGKKLPLAVAEAIAECWRKLRGENSVLRAVVNGRLVSVPEDIYDSFILRELENQDEEFIEAKLIGRLLGVYQLGISDAWLALRIERFISEGLLEPISTAKDNEPLYHRLLRKCCISGSYHSAL